MSNCKMVNVSIVSILKLALKTSAMENESESLLSLFSFLAVLSNLSATLTNSPFFMYQNFYVRYLLSLETYTHSNVCIPLSKNPFHFCPRIFISFQEKIESESERMTTKAAKKKTGLGTICWAERNWLWPSSSFRWSFVFVSIWEE